MAAGSFITAIIGGIALFFKYRIDSKDALVRREEQERANRESLLRAEQEAREGKFTEVEKVSPILGSVITTLNMQLEKAHARLSEAQVRVESLEDENQEQRQDLLGLKSEEILCAQRIRSLESRVSELELELVNCREAKRNASSL